MIRTNIKLVKQEFAIVPSTFTAAEIGPAVLEMVDEETKEVFTYGPVNDILWDAGAFDWDDEARNWEFDQLTAEEGWYYTLSDDGNYFIITLLSTIGLREGARYSFEIKSDTAVLYRDAMFVSNRGGVTEVYSYPNNYVSASSGSDQYMIL